MHLADCAQLEYGLGTRHQLEDASERLPLERAVESGDDHHLALGRHRVGKFDHIVEELSLVDANHVSLGRHVRDVAQLGALDGINDGCSVGSSVGSAVGIGVGHHAPPALPVNMDSVFCSPNA